MLQSSAVGSHLPPFRGAIVRPHSPSRWHATRRPGALCRAQRRFGTNFRAKAGQENSNNSPHLAQCDCQTASKVGRPSRRVRATGARMSALENLLALDECKAAERRLVVGNECIPAGCAGTRDDERVTPATGQACFSSASEGNLMPKIRTRDRGQ
jgi:hypothetical protein